MVTKEQILDALKTNPELLTELTPMVLESEKGKQIIQNKADVIYKDKIADEVSRIHKQYDADIYEVLGVKKGFDEEGKKIKTYEFNKSLLKDYKALKERESSLNNDVKIKELNAEIEQLKLNGGGKHWEQTFNTEKQKWQTQIEDYKKQVSELQKQSYNSKIETDIRTGMSELNFNPDIPKPAIEALVNNVSNRLKQHSKIEEGKIIYLNENGTVIHNNEYKPESAKGILQKELQDVLLKPGTPGGGATTDLKGRIETSTVEGKDQKQLILKGGFKSHSDFTQQAEQALANENISTEHDDYYTLLDEAYVRYGIDNLPSV